MRKSYIQLLKDTQYVLAKSQSLMIHEQYFKLANELEKIIVRIDQVILDEHDKQHTCKCCPSSGQLELPSACQEMEEKNK